MLEEGEIISDVLDLKFNLIPIPEDEKNDL